MSAQTIILIEENIVIWNFAAILEPFEILLASENDLTATISDYTDRMFVYTLRVKCSLYVVFMWLLVV